jgi:hypothetical protein
VTDIERDEAIAQALRDLPVPPHRATFWADLEAGIATGDGALTDGADGRRPATGELPAVAPMRERRSNRRTPLLVAAAVLVLLGAVGFVTLGDDGDDDELADQSTDTSAEADSTEPDEPAVTTVSTAASEDTAASGPVGDDGSPEAVVTSWLDALGSGDVDTAAELTGPRTAAYIESQAPDATLEGFLTESQEGFGAWAGSEDRTVTLLPLEPIEFDGGTLQVVVVSGTHPGEGEPGSRVDVFPVVDDGEGYKVEHLAFDPGRDNDPTFTLPDETEHGLGTMAPGEEVNVFVPAQGTVYLQLDGGEVDEDTTSEVAGRPFALFNPEGDLTPGDHVLVLVAVGDDGTVTAFGGSFTVAA